MNSLSQTFKCRVPFTCPNSNAIPIDWLNLDAKFDIPFCNKFSPHHQGGFSKFSLHEALLHKHSLMTNTVWS